MKGLQTQNSGRYSVYKHCLIWNGRPSDEIELGESEVRNLFRETKAWMIQNCYDWDTDDETNFWHIIKSTYDFNDYSNKIKKYIEKANCKFEIRLVAKREIIEQGYDVLKSAIEGYRVSTTALPLKEKFVSYINSLDESYDIWGCIDRETHRIQAYSIVRKHSNWAEFLTSKVNPEFLPKYYPMYGLYDARNRYYLENLCFDFDVILAI